jgi:hypothetical protein
MYQWPSDYVIESKLISELTNQKNSLLRDIFPEGDFICFLQSYGTSVYLKEHTNEESREYLDNRITRNSGGVWWIIVLSNKNVDKFYRISESVRPNIERAKCVPLDKSSINQHRWNKHTIFFNINVRE